MYGITEPVFRDRNSEYRADYPVWIHWKRERRGKRYLELSLRRMVLYVLTSSEKLNGAAVLFYPGMCESSPKHFQMVTTLLPSSTQECLIAPMEEISWFHH